VSAEPSSCVPANIAASSLTLRLHKLSRVPRPPAPCSEARPERCALPGAVHGRCGSAGTAAGQLQAGPAAAGARIPGDPGSGLSLSKTGDRSGLPASQPHPGGCSVPGTTWEGTLAPLPALSSSPIPRFRFLPGIHGHAFPRTALVPLAVHARLSSKRALLFCFKLVGRG
jgi:hypothetical protein